MSRYYWINQEVVRIIKVIGTREDVNGKNSLYLLTKLKQDVSF